MNKNDIKTILFTMESHFIQREEVANDETQGLTERATQHHIATGILLSQNILASYAGLKLNDIKSEYQKILSNGKAITNE